MKKGISLECFEIMHLDGAQPDAISFVSMLKVCGSMQVADRNTNGSILECFKMMMRLEGAQPNIITFFSMLKVCGSMQAFVNIRIC